MSDTKSRSWHLAIVEWSTWSTALGAPSTTLTTRRQHLHHLARRVEVGPWDVTPGMLLDYVGGQTWARETRRSRRTTLRAFYGWAVEAGHIAKSPALVLPRVKAAPVNPLPAPDSVYLPALRQASARELLMLRLAAEHGLRRCEVAVVHSDDLVEDLDGWSLVVHGKGDRERMVPLLDDVADLLRGLPAGYAFPGRMDGHLSPRWVGRLVGDLLPGAWTMHKLRHRAGTAWHEECNGDVFIVQDLLGHASPATTRAYVRVRNDKLRATLVSAARRRAG